MRRSIKAEGRFPWKELFFKKDLATSLNQEDAGEYQYSLEMLRLAPSAVNKQPWRVVVTDEAVYFFKKHTLSAEPVGADMQRIDVGIGICHCHLATIERKE